MLRILNYSLIKWTIYDPLGVQRDQKSDVKKDLFKYVLFSNLIVDISAVMSFKIDVGY